MGHMTLQGLWRRLRSSPWRFPLLAVLPVTGLLVWVSRFTFYGDEGFQLQSALLLGDGRLPSLDFFFPYAPLFPYVYGSWMKLFGPGWHSAHVLSALFSSLTVLTAATWLARRHASRPGWVVALAVLLLGCNPQFAWLGTVGHPYAMTMCSGLLAYVLVVTARRRLSAGLAALAGAMAGAAVLSTWLAGPLLPVMSLWLWLQAPVAARWRLLAGFVAGAAPWLLPLGWLLWQAPDVMLFNWFGYHLLYRRGAYHPAAERDLLDGLHQLLGWTRAWENLPLVLLSGFALLLAVRRRHDPLWPEQVLAAALVAALAMFLCLPNPTFPYYFVLLLPFLCVLACDGAMQVTALEWSQRRASALAICAVLLVAVDLARPAGRLSEEAFYLAGRWPRLEDLGRQLQQRLGPRVRVSMPDMLHVLSGRRPLQGMEHADAMATTWPAGQAEHLKITPLAQLPGLIVAGKVDALVIDDGADPAVLETFAAAGLVHERWDSGFTTVDLFLRRADSASPPP